MNKIINAIQKGIKIGLLESGFNFSLDDLDHMEDYGLKKKKLDRQFFKDEFDRQQDQYENFIFLSVINKILNEEPLTNKENEQFNIYSNKLVAVYKVKDSAELNNLIYKVMQQFDPKVNLNWIDVSAITDMSYLFAFEYITNFPDTFLDNTKFNGDISKWDVSNVKKMDYMFEWSKFDGDISNWDVSHVENMENMFCRSKFNGNISRWDVSNVKNMGCMFICSKFDGNISEWDVSNVTKMYSMFENSRFDGDISKWDVSNVENMKEMFKSSQFNQNISKWNIQRVKNHQGAFINCPIKKEYKPKFND